MRRSVIRWGKMKCAAAGRLRGTLGNALRAGRDQHSVTLAAVVPFALASQTFVALAVGSALIVAQVLVVVSAAARPWAAALAVDSALVAALVLVVASAAAQVWAAALYQDLVAAWAVDLAWALDLASYPDLCPDSGLASDSALASVSVAVLYLDSAGV